MVPDVGFLEYKAYKLRVGSLEATTQAGSGHPTSALSAADIVAALFFYVLKYNLEDPYDPNNDRFILSKGHAVPVVYAAWKELGVIDENDLLSLREFNSVFEGHPTARFAYNEAATGSLGCGLSVGLGMALSSRLSKHSFYTYVMLGDSEMTEGSVWEAIEIAAYYKTNNLVAIVDLNKFGQSTETIDDHDVIKHANKWKAFGWNAITIDGHDMCAILEALDIAKKSIDKPTVIVAKTYKGYGLDNIEDKPGYHGKAISKKDLPELLKRLEQRFTKAAHFNVNNIGNSRIIKKFNKPEHKLYKMPEIFNSAVLSSIAQDFLLDLNKEKLATRKAYGYALASLGSVTTNLIVLDAEVKNSTFAEIFEKRYPERFIQCFIAEQNMAGMATGITLRNFITFSSTFGAFLTRAHDQIRMASIGQVALRIAGSHVGVSIGQDGPSQMALEDIAQMRAIPESIVLYPSDAVSTYKLVNLMANYYQGISYIRLTREETPKVYNNNEEFEIGGCKVIKQSDKDKVCIVAAGVTLFEALKAYEKLKQENILVSIIDLYSIKPLDNKTILDISQKSNNKLITVEDHYIQGGLGEAVCYALKNNNIYIENLAVKELSRSGSPEDLLKYHKIDSDAIIELVNKML